MTFPRRRRSRGPSCEQKISLDIPSTFDAISAGTEVNFLVPRSSHRGGSRKRSDIMDGPSCGCILAVPAAFMGLSTFHTALCMKHAEARFCMPTKSVASAFIVRAESGPAPRTTDPVREKALIESIVSSVPYSSGPPNTMKAHQSQKALALKWDVMRRLSEP